MAHLPVPGAWEQDRSITVEGFIQLCEDLCKPSLALGCERVPNFVSGPDLAEYWQAIDWWPKDAPGIYAAPHLSQMAGYYVFTPRLKAMTFREGLMLLAQKTVDWLDHNGRSTTNPNESATERASRKARESTARMRQRNGKHVDPVVKESAAAVLTAYKNYQAACQYRKDQDAINRGMAETCLKHYHELKQRHDDLLASKSEQEQ